MGSRASGPFVEQSVLPIRCARRVLLVVVLGSVGCATRPPLPTLSLHAVLTLRQNAAQTRETGSHDFGLQAQLAFRPRGRARAITEEAQIPIALPRQPDCQYALACEWAQLAEESTLSALGVGP